MYSGNRLFQIYKTVVDQYNNANCKIHHVAPTLVDRKCETTDNLPLTRFTATRITTFAILVNLRRTAWYATATPKHAVYQPSVLFTLFPCCPGTHLPQMNLSAPKRAHTCNSTGAWNISHDSRNERDTVEEKTQATTPNWCRKTKWGRDWSRWKIQERLSTAHMNLVLAWMLLKSLNHLEPTIGPLYIPDMRSARRIIINLYTTEIKYGRSSINSLTRTKSQANRHSLQKQGEQNTEPVLHLENLKMMYASVSARAWARSGSSVAGICAGGMERANWLHSRFGVAHTYLFCACCGYCKERQSRGIKKLTLSIGSS